MKNKDEFIFWDEMWNVSGDTKADQTNNNVSLLPDEQWDEDHALDIVLNQMVEDMEDWDNTLLDGLDELDGFEEQ